MCCWYVAFKIISPQELSGHQRSCNTDPLNSESKTKSTGPLPPPSATPGELQCIHVDVHF